jgi:hypothetical protein
MDLNLIDYCSSAPYIRNYAWKHRQSLEVIVYQHAPFFLDNWSQMLHILFNKLVVCKLFHCELLQTSKCKKWCKYYMTKEVKKLSIMKLIKYWKEFYMLQLIFPIANIEVWKVQLIIEFVNHTWTLVTLEEYHQHWIAMYKTSTSSKKVTFL